MLGSSPSCISYTGISTTCFSILGLRSEDGNPDISGSFWPMLTAWPNTKMLSCGSPKLSLRVHGWGRGSGGQVYKITWQRSKEQVGSRWAKDWHRGQNTMILNSCFTAVGRKGAVAPGVRKSSGEKDFLETPLPAPQQNLLRKPPLEFFHSEALSIPPFT